MDEKSVRHSEVVKAMLEAKAVDFEAIGRVIAELGPSLALAEKPVLATEGSMLRLYGFVHLYRLDTPIAPMEKLEALAAAATKLES